MREYSVPAEFTLDEKATCGDIVFDLRDADAKQPVFRRKRGDRWEQVTAGEIADQVTAVAKGLIAQGLQPGDRVGLLCSTRIEWPILDFGIWAAGGVTVPIYDSSSSGQVDWILEDSDATVLVIENQAHREVIDQISDGLRSVTKVYQVDAGDDGQNALDELTAQGADVSDDEVTGRRRNQSSSDPATLIYTSGTTGRPKGVELTHANLLGETAAVKQSSLGDFISDGRRTLMFLPMAHVLARAITIVCVQSKVEVGFTSDIPQLVPEFGRFAPDFILSVPRVFEKVYNTARQRAHDDGKGKIFDAAAEVAMDYSRAEEKGGAGLLLRAKHTLFEKLVYTKLRAALGGRCELAISGGAPLAEWLGHFFRGVGLPIYEGYGLTETTAAVAVNTPAEYRVGTVGKPLPGNSARIDEDGELCLKGNVVFGGYWHNEDATKESVTDGWFHTGDIGSIDEDGYLRITGRKKEIIVTAGGKNVSPSGLEDSLRTNPLISQAMVVGDQKPFIAALITIDPDGFDDWKSNHGKDSSASVSDFVDDEDLRKEVQAAVTEANKTVSHAESIKKFRILPADFSEETGEMTPTMKVKRNVVVDKYSDDIEAIYAK
ncbi:AMP-dependent synthetase/ligase [Williamsia sterculiae]|uniref:Acyl-CoA synthetase n=1 Tax=Williamsia sterculiae TaxID=1344003 RepID=A0A1N7H7V0_9NOCA|nr:long-chain fatty acid--CoA ligase [Williamsia sterculiae]SIS20770.1 long-chain acyl-CoA synthetase [Williamsia sterculiae]